ncbi:MAG: DUF2157 domain-containing protein [Curvibacter sp.]
MSEPCHAITLTEAELQAAARDGLISPQQAGQLWARWSVAAVPAAQAASPGQADLAGPRFSFTQVFYYFGGLVAIGAMTLFMTLGWSRFGDWGLLAIALGYLVGALAVADHLQRRGLRTPAGLLAALAVCLVPLAVWALQSGLGLWPPGGPDHYRAYHAQIDWRWLTLEFATLAAGVVMLWRYRLPFMVMPIAVTVWYLWMDVAHMLMQHSGFDYTFMRDLSLVFGIATCCVAMWVDVRSRLAQGEWRQDFAFWLYLFGALMFWGGLSLQDSGTEWGKALYALINVGLVFLGAAIGRRVFTVFGALGVAGYLGYLSWRVFRDSLLFPFALTLLGLAVIALGIWWQRHEKAIEARLGAWLPAGLRPR